MFTVYAGSMFTQIGRSQIDLIGLFILALFGLGACAPSNLTEITLSQENADILIPTLDSPVLTPTEVAALPTVMPTATPNNTNTPVPIETEMETMPTTEPTVEPTAEPTSTAVPPVSPTPRPLPGSQIFTFETGEPGWYTVDDDVMGGVSSSEAVVTEESYLRFYGNMSLDNNGGFSSVRSDWGETDLTGKDGVLIRVLGDGKTYRLRIRTDKVGREISYNALFETRADEWVIVYIPFDQMVPTYRGFVMDVPSLDPATIGSFGFMLSDKQPGEFELLVDWMRAVNRTEVVNSDL